MSWSGQISTPVAFRKGLCWERRRGRRHLQKLLGRETVFTEVVLRDRPTYLLLGSCLHFCKVLIVPIACRLVNPRGFRWIPYWMISSSSFSARKYMQSNRSSTTSKLTTKETATACQWMSLTPRPNPTPSGNKGAPSPTRSSSLPNDETRSRGGVCIRSSRKKFIRMVLQCRVLLRLPDFNRASIADLESRE